jgi:tetratricopeptide (TPR) repeat protein
MEPSRNSLPGDMFNPAVKKNPPGTPPVPVDPSGSERVSVEAVEREIRSRTRHKDYSTSRSRRHLREENSGSGRYLWFAVALVALVYLSFLAYTTIKGRNAPPGKTADSQMSPDFSKFKKRKEPVKLKLSMGLLTEATNVITKPVDPVKVAESFIASETSAPPAESRVDVKDLITKSKAAAQLADEGRRLILEGQFDRAEIKLELSAKLAPGVFAVLVDWATSLMEQQRWLAAQHVLIKALASEPTSINARLMLARTCYELKQSDDALALSRWALETDPYSEVAHQISAEVLTGLNRNDDAIWHLNRLVAIDSNNHVAENNLGAALIRMGQYAQAIRAFENVIRDEPGNSQAYYFMAVCYMYRDEPELAVDVLNKASERFGQPFVLAWTKGSDFDPLRKLESFKARYGENAPIVVEQPAAEPVTTNTP